jgi:transposase
VVQIGKKDVMLGNGTFNRNFEKVKDPRFVGDDFFDPMDIVQVKYEMLKDVAKNGKTVSGAADDFGFSRTAYYSIRDAFEKNGIPGLIPEKPGPKKPHKLTTEYQRQIDDHISSTPGASSGELAAAINSGSGIGISISKRTVERYRAKKKQR